MAPEYALEFAQSAGETIGEQFKSVLTAAGASDRVRSDEGGDKDHTQAFTSAKGVIDVLIQGNRLSEKVLQATKAKTFKEKEAAVLSIIGGLADTLAATALSAKQANGALSTGDADNPLTHADESTKSAYGRGNPGDPNDPTGLIAEGIKGAFILGADSYGAVKALHNKDYKAFALALTVGLTQVTASATTGGLQRAVMPDLHLLSEEEHNELDGLSPTDLLNRKLDMSGSTFASSDRETFLGKFEDPKYLAQVNKNISSMIGDLNVLESKPKINEAVKKNTATAVAKLEEEKTGNALEDLKKKLADPQERKTYMDDLEKQADEEHKALQQLIEEASSPEDPNDEEAVKKSLKAIDTLLADIKASQMKMKLIETIANGGVRAVTAIFPVTGLADAIRKLTLDAIALAKKSAEVEKWRKNVNLAEASNSIYFHAIKERHTQAAIQVSQKTLNTFFSVVGVALEIARLADATQASTGLSISMNMGRALSDFGYKTYGRAKIVYGWKKYLEARKDPANRKAARAAIAGNSTLAKCVLAYGIVEDRDPIARQVGRNSGLTPEVLVSSTDVCSAVVRYFETLYSDDPVILRRVPKVENWHPCTPDLTLKSWFLFKKAATTRAYPRMAKDNCLTPNIDRSLKELHKLCNGDPFNYPEVRDEQLSKPAGIQALIEYAGLVDAELESLKKSLSAYSPVTGEPENPNIEKWSAGQRHTDMEAVVDSMEAQIELVHREILEDLKIY